MMRRFTTKLRVAAVAVASMSFIVATLTTWTSCAHRTEPAAPVEVLTLDAIVLDPWIDARIAALTPRAEVSVWLGGATGEAWYAREAETWRPAASAIKTAYLVELFAARDGRLNMPLSTAAAVLRHDDHPAWKPFDEDDLDDIRNELGVGSTHRLGRLMIHGRGVSNAVYNAAANLATATLGGPEALTERIRRRWDKAPGFAVRRYMLGRRDVTGDNELVPSSLADVLQSLACETVPGASAAAVTEMRRVLFLESHPEFGDHYFKSGALTSEPMCRIASGFWEKDGQVIVYVVMGEQPLAATEDDPESEQAFERLSELVGEITETVVTAARADLGLLETTP